MSPTISQEEARRETLENYAVFLEELLPDLLEVHLHEWALLRERRLIEVYPTAMAANQAGRDQFPDRRFSIQEVTDRPLFVSHTIAQLESPTTSRRDRSLTGRA